MNTREVLSPSLLFLGDKALLHTQTGLKSTLVQVGLGLMILLFQFPRNWDYGYVGLGLAYLEF